MVYVLMRNRNLAGFEKCSYLHGKGIEECVPSRIEMSSHGNIIDS